MLQMLAWYVCGDFDVLCTDLYAVGRLFEVQCDYIWARHCILYCIIALCCLRLCSCYWLAGICFVLAVLGKCVWFASWVGAFCFSGEYYLDILQDCPTLQGRKSWWQYLRWVEKALSGYSMHVLHCKKFCKECVCPRVWLISLCWLPADTSLISAGYVVQSKKKLPSYRFSIWLVYLFWTRCFQPVGRVNFQLPSPAHSVFHASALGHCAQACDAAKGEKKRYSRRQVRCSFNLKLKAFSQLVSN